MLKTYLSRFGGSIFLSELILGSSMVEHPAVKQCVVGSNPIPPAVSPCSVAERCIYLAKIAGLIPTGDILGR